MIQNYWRTRVSIPVLLIISMIWISVIIGSIMFWRDEISPFSTIVAIIVSALIAWRWKNSLSR